MQRIAISCLSAMAAMAALLPATPVLAQATDTETWVSGTGNDGNTATRCGRTTPCRTFSAALSVTSVGGVIGCIDSVITLSPFAISTDVTIDCTGNYSAVFATSGSAAIDINTAGIKVTLRGLTIYSAPAFVATAGINITAGATVQVDRCNIFGFVGAPGIGINLAPPAGATGKLRVSDSVITDNGRPASGGGIIIQPSGSGSALVEILRTRVENNTYGIFANGMGSTGVISVQVRDSVVGSNVVNGVSAFTAAGHSTTSITLDRSSSILNGGAGILAQGAVGFVTLTDSTVMSNVTGLSTVNGGGTFSYQNNRLTGNVTDGAPTAVLTVK